MRINQEDTHFAFNTNTKELENKEKGDPFFILSIIGVLLVLVLFIKLTQDLTEDNNTRQMSQKIMQSAKIDLEHAQAKHKFLAVVKDHDLKAYSVLTPLELTKEYFFNESDRKFAQNNTFLEYLVEVSIGGAKTCQAKVLFSPEIALEVFHARVESLTCEGKSISTESVFFKEFDGNPVRATNVSISAYKVDMTAKYANYALFAPSTLIPTIK